MFITAILSQIYYHFKNQKVITTIQNSQRCSLSEKQAVLGIEAKRRERFIRKSGGFGDRSKATRTVYPKIRRFWGEVIENKNNITYKNKKMTTGKQ